MKKFTILLLLPLFINNFLSAQDRTATKTYSWEQESGILTKATGWAYNEKLDEWVENQNYISDRKSNSSDYKFTATLWEAETFNSLQFKTFKHNDNLYFCLVRKKEEGKYKYPNIKKDWEHYETTFYTVYTPEEYKKFFNPTEETVKIPFLRTMRVEWFQTISDSDIIKDLIDRIENKEPGTISYFYIKKWGENIRFLPSMPDYKKYDFQNNYFEVSEEDFGKFLLK